ncbi:MAG: hypothetical protein KF720_07820 [Rubrivivax sp.]|nr:hypothetical protein [Rubrivivax sp.]
MNTRLFLSAATMALLLSACGGDDDDVAMPADDAVPASALASAQAFSRYVGSLPANDHAEPLSVEGVDPPTSDTDEPIDVN